MTQVRTHRALVRIGQRLECRQVPTPVPGPGEALVAIDYVGVCGTDLQILNGTRSGEAQVLGHEGTGIVEHLGPGAPEWLRGRRVVFNPVNPTRPDEVLGHSYDGLLQERYLVPARLIAALLLVVAPAVLVPHVVLTEPLGTAVYGMELLRKVCEPRSVAVVGAGPAGLLYAVVARAAGAENVFLLHRSPERLAWAVAAGIIRSHEAVLLGRGAPASTLRDLTAGRGADAAFLCTTRTGAPAGLQTALSVVRPGGCIDLVTGFPAGCGAHDYRPFEDVRCANVCGSTRAEAHRPHFRRDGKRIWLTGHRGTSHAHLCTAMKLLGQMPKRFGRLLTQIVPMDQAANASHRLSEDRRRGLGGRECVKVVVDLTR
jgi:threonine dehydrogenase-like Zn-dependent dehydrogenase